MTKCCLQDVIRSIIHILDGSAYNKPYSVNLWNQQTDHKYHTFRFIDHVQACIIVKNNSDSAINNNTKLHY